MKTRSARSSARLQPLKAGKSSAQGMRKSESRDTMDDDIARKLPAFQGLPGVTVNSGMRANYFAGSAGFGSAGVGAGASPFGASGFGASGLDSAGFAGASGFGSAPGA